MKYLSNQNPGDISGTVIGESPDFRSDNVILRIVWDLVGESLDHVCWEGASMT